MNSSVKSNASEAITPEVTSETCIQPVIYSQYQEKPIRTVLIDGEQWLVAKDVCDALGLTNPTEAIKSLDDDEKMTLSNTEGHSGQRGGAQF